MAAFDAELGALLARPGGLTAADAAARAAKHSPAAARKRAETEAARTTIGTIKIALLPISKLSASYTRLSDVPDLRFAAPPAPAIEAQLNAFHLGYDLAIPLTDLLLRLPPAKKAAEDQARASELGSQAAALDAGAQAEQLYYEWVRASLATVVAARQVVAGRVDPRAGRGAGRGPARVARRPACSSRRARPRPSWRWCSSPRRSTVLGDQLRMLIGAGPRRAARDRRRHPRRREVPPLDTDAALVQAAMSRRYEAKALAAATAGLAHHRDDTKVQRLPKVNLFGQLNYEQPNQRYFATPDQFHLSWAAGVQVTWSPNDFLYADPNLAEIDAQARALAADRRGLAMSIESQIASARSAMTLAEAAYATSQRGLAAAAESYRVRQDLLASERATATELIVAEGALTQARLAAINALIDRRIAWSRLRHAAGLDVP
jgi:outer membrane protein